MKLYDIIKDVAKTSLPDMEISDVTSDTRKAVKAGSMFVCIKGKTFDGHDAAKDMIEKGCTVSLNLAEEAGGDNRGEHKRGFPSAVCGIFRSP